ncbi:MAG: nucleotidyltransferase family protein [Chthoniobacterales bacterium]
MAAWEQILCGPETAIREGLQVITNSSLQLALVIAPDRKLLGVVTDGDIRRGILRGVALEASLTEVMNAAPMTISPGESPDAVLRLMRSRSVHHLPIVDGDGRIVGLEVLDQLLNREVYENTVVLMAGGLGSRLGELTRETPKPLLPVGNRPILETIIQNFRQYGFYRFEISINYLAEKVREYFGDGSRFGVDIRYIEETQRLGTAGSLSLLAGQADRPIVVMNGDVLTQVNWHQLMDFHREQGADATMCVREVGFQVPYGVVRIEGNTLTGIEEKPTQTFFVNAGIYVIEPHVLGEIPAAEQYDMPQLFDAIVARGGRAVVFPVCEYWMDIGQAHDFHRANGDYPQIFAAQ